MIKFLVSDQSDFLAIKTGQIENIAEGNYSFALVNIFKQIGGAKNVQITSEDKETDYKQKAKQQNAGVTLSPCYFTLLTSVLVLVFGLL